MSFKTEEVRPPQICSSSDPIAMTLDKFSLYDRIASLSFPTKLGRTNLCQKPYVQVETIEKGKESIDESESEEPLLYTRRRVVSRWPSQYMIAAFLILNAAVLTVIYFTAIGAASPQIISKLFPPGKSKNQSCNYPLCLIQLDKRNTRKGSSIPRI